MTFRLVFVAPFVLSAPFLLAQQTNQPPENRESIHHAPAADRQDHERHAENYEQMHDERMDLDEVGLPSGEFWLNPDIVSFAEITPDQVHRLAETYLQGTLKLIQLDANVDMEEAKLEPMLASPEIDANAAIAQLDRIAEAKAAVDKADARLAFGLRATLTPAQLTRLRTGMSHRMPEHEVGDGQAYHPAPPPPQN